MAPNQKSVHLDMKYYIRGVASTVNIFSNAHFSCSPIKLSKDFQHVETFRDGVFSIKTRLLVYANY